MNEIKEDFEGRVEEIELYFNFVRKAAEAHSNIGKFFVDAHTPEAISSDVKKILKANLYLLLYNLIESSFKKTLKKLISEINGSESRFQILIPEIRKIWLQDETNFFAKEAPNVDGGQGKKIDFYYPIIENICAHILSIPTDPKISGNLDAKRIKELSSKYGVLNEAITDASGDKLLTVKTKRNHLAHGNITFQECGADYSIEELEQIKTQVIQFMWIVLLQFELFIQNESYKTAG